MTTPPPKKGGDGDSGSPSDNSPRIVAVERVVSNIGGTAEIPKLSKTNYHEWALEMQVNLEGMELWDAVEGGNAERGKDRRALAVILRGVTPEMKSGLATKKSAKEAWEAVKSMRMGDERVQEAKAQLLLKQFENVAFLDGESIDDFAMRLGSLVAELRGLGEDIEEVRVVKKLLRVVPAKFNQVACSIEMLMDLKKMSLEELVGQLRLAEERAGVEVAADGVGRLLLTKEQWEERRRQRSGKQRTRGGEGARRGSDERRGGRNDDHNDNDDDRSSTSSGSKRGGSRYRGRCFDCGEHGHMAKDCPGKKKERALLTDVDDEPTLL